MIPYPGDKRVDVVVRLRHVAGYYLQAAIEGVDEIQDLRKRLLRINAINDNPAIYNDEIDRLSTVKRDAT